MRSLRGGSLPLARARQACFAQYSQVGAPQLASQDSLTKRQIASSKQVDFAPLAKAVQVFYAHNKHFVIPTGFRVPLTRRIDGGDDGVASSDALWPSELQDYPLGRRLKTLLTNPVHQASNFAILSELRAIGFPLDVDWREYVWSNATIAALEAFKSIKGHMLVRKDFEVPTGDERWPRPTWGMKLGVKVINLRQHRYELLTREVEDLERVGFVWDVSDFVWTHRVLPALKTFKAIHQHCLVRREFIVPAELPWPRETWGMHLGHVVGSIRSSRSLYAAEVERDRPVLDALGFVWNVSDDKWKHQVLPALETFALVHGHRSVDNDFIVPARAPWPKASWGLKLGRCVHNIRYNGHYQSGIRRDVTLLEQNGWLNHLTEGWGLAWMKEPKPES